MLLNKGKYRGKAAIVLLSFALLSGCGAKPGDTVSLPPLEISESEKLPYNEWEDLPHTDSLASELHNLAAELEMDSISAGTYLRYSEGDKEDGENDECTLSFDYKGTLAFGKLILIGEDWHTVFIMDAKTAELYFSSPEYEDLIPFYQNGK